MARDTLNDGDVVRLKTGGPPMTIGEVRITTYTAECMWFEGAELHREVFGLEDLERCEPGPSTAPTPSITGG